MQRMAIWLSALLLIVFATKTSAAQDAIALEAAQRTARCGVSFDCPHYEAPSEVQARKSSGHRTAASSAGPPSPTAPTASQPTWRENASLMDSSWRRWPSLTDF
jgi:hypothetical protein